MAQNYVQGGWYDNPATGQNQRWWNGAFLPVGQVEPGVLLQGQGGREEQYQDPIQGFIQPIIDEYTQKAEAYTKKYNEFEKNNPFVFDKILGEERAKVKQRLDPYYEQTLGDFLTNVDLKRKRGLEDERTVLTQLNQNTDSFTGREKAQLTDAIDKSREGYADAGLYTSGAALRDQGRLEVQTGQTLADKLQDTQRKTEEIQTNQKRNQQDLALEEKQKKRDLGQDQYYQTESQTQTAFGQRQQVREFERGQFTGAPPGTDPTQFSQTLYGMLR